MASVWVPLLAAAVAYVAIGYALLLTFVYFKPDSTSWWDNAFPFLLTIGWPLMPVLWLVWNAGHLVVAGFAAGVERMQSIGQQRAKRRRIPVGGVDPDTPWPRR